MEYNRDVTPSVYHWWVPVCLDGITDTIGSSIVSRILSVSENVKKCDNFFVILLSVTSDTNRHLSIFLSQEEKNVK